MRVQFSDAGVTQIVSYFGGPQDPAVFPNQAEIGPDDPRWAAYFNALPPQVRDGLPTPT